MKITEIDGELFIDEQGAVGYINVMGNHAIFSFTTRSVSLTAEQRAEICAYAVPRIDKINTLALVTMRLEGADDSRLRLHRSLLATIPPVAPKPRPYLKVTYDEPSTVFGQKIVRVLLDDRVVGQFSLLSSGWKFMWIGDTWARVSTTKMAEIQQLIHDKKYMLDLTTRFTR
jgi:hypothetical protein